MPVKTKIVKFKEEFELFCGLILFLGVCLSMFEIILRVGFNRSYDLLLDGTIWLTIWSVLLISGFLLPENGHVSIDFFIERLPGKIRYYTRIFNSLVTLLYGCIFFYGGILLVYKFYVMNAVFPRYIPVPMSIVESCIPIGMLGFIIFALVDLKQTFQGITKEKNLM